MKNKFYSDYLWLLIKFPNGLLCAKNIIPINIDGYELEIIIFRKEDFDKKLNIVSFGLFLPNHRYSRKTLIINEIGEISEDTDGTLPYFDLTESEPKFISSNEQIVTIVMEKLRMKFKE